ncbi:MAG: TIM barrel protein [Clostridia bacterium]|nr:TIM barrel protein [Clostridia bacterium]
MYKLGLVSVSFRDHTPEEIVSCMKRCGLEYIEWGSDVHAPRTDTERLEYLKRLCNESGIGISSYGSYFRLGVDSVEEIDSYLNAAKILGTDIMRIWAGNKSFSQYSDKELESILEDARYVSEKAKESEVTICFERHTGTITDSPEGALFLMEKIKSENLRLYYQPCQYNGKEFSTDLARKISKYTKVAHVFNWKGNEKYPLEDAVWDWKDYLAELPDDIYLLLEFMPDGKIESLEKEATALYRICKGE